MTFLEALKRAQMQGRIPVIADIKCRSPKEGDLLAGRDPVRLAGLLAEAGVPALSVVTEAKEFGGSLELLRRLASEVPVPFLRKDFLTTRQDLIETKEAGASAVLLMYATLGREKLRELYREALAIGLTPLVETHTREDLEDAKALGAQLVGINNRDILQLERDDGGVAHAQSLIDAASTDAFIVVESGIANGREVRQAVRAGADTALVGTALLRADDIAEAYRGMARPWDLKVCGLMNKTDAEQMIRGGADMLGFVTEYPVNVPWNLREEETAELLRAVSGRARTCIVTGGSPEKIIGLAERLRPDAVQLHDSAPLQDTMESAGRLAGHGFEVIRSVPLSAEIREKMFGTAQLAEIPQKLAGSGVNALLLDARSQENAAAGGGTVSLSSAEAQALREAVRAAGLRLVVGGGITGQTVADAAALFRPDTLDVMTGVEDAPGRKSPEKLKALLQAAYAGLLS